jgi:hypothetical protein
MAISKCFRLKVDLKPYSALIPNFVSDRIWLHPASCEIWRTAQRHGKNTVSCVFTISKADALQAGSQMPELL